MSNRFIYGTSTRFGRGVAKCVDDFIQTRDRLNRIVAACQSMTYGSPTAYDTLESEFQLAQGQGADFVYLLTLIANKMEEISAADLGRLDSGNN